MKQQKESDLILVGVIYSAHGVRGDVMVKSFTEPFDNIAKMALCDKNNQQIKFKKIRIAKNNSLIFHLDDCNDRNMAESFKGKELFCQRGNLPKIQEEDEFYVNDLQGMNVLNEQREVIGVIAGVFNYGAGDIIEIKFNDGSLKMFPFTKEFFPLIDGKMIVLK